GAPPSIFHHRSLLYGAFWAELRDAKQACVSWFANGMKFRLRRGFGVAPAHTPPDAMLSNTQSAILTPLEV
ncbi:MAG: hypothetical protein WCI17_06895, partial [bacterium]